MSNYFSQITGYRKSGDGCDLCIHLDEDIRYKIDLQHIRFAEIGLDDGRHISAEQRKKIYATIRDIADYTGYPPEIAKEWMKYRYIELTGNDYFSLSDCSVTTAREFINVLMDYCLYHGIILTESGLKRTDDINAYLIQCIRYKRCCICGKKADIHHVDAVGMGNDRKHYDDRNHEIIALCREHHVKAHSLGNIRFMGMYKVYGIKRFQAMAPENYGNFENMLSLNG